MANVRRVSYRIHLLTLSTFEPHPEAKEATLDWPYFLSHNTSPFISVMDNVVSLQASIHRGHLPEGGLCIWDWKRGVRVAVRASPCSIELLKAKVLIRRMPSPTLSDAIFQTRRGHRELLVSCQGRLRDGDRQRRDQRHVSQHARAFDRFQRSRPLIVSPLTTSFAWQTFDSSYTPTESAPDFVPPPILLAIHELPEADSRPAMMSLRLDPAPGTHPGLPPFAEGEGRTPMFVPDGGERLLVLDLTFVVPGQDGGWGALNGQPESLLYAPR